MLISTSFRFQMWSVGKVTVAAAGIVEHQSLDGFA
jgi:hypothetical protein